MSRTSFDIGCQRLKELRILAGSIPSDIGPSAQGSMRADISENEQPISVDAPNEAENIVISMNVPRTAKTKGSKRIRKEIECGDASSSLHKQKKGHKKVQNVWYVRRHYSTTCPLNENVAGRGRGGHRGRRGTM
jgi:hypothetical protein